VTILKRSDLAQISETYPKAIQIIAASLVLPVPEFLAKVDAGEIERDRPSLKVN
jgi:hypothetical protein